MPKTRRKVNIIGHRNPDTDSICSALAYTYLKNQLGDAVYEARRAGQINRETAFVLKHFGVEPPRLCTDVSPQVKDIDIREQPGIDKEMSIRAAWSMMRDTEIDTLCAIDEDKEPWKAKCCWATPMPALPPAAFLLAPARKLWMVP